MWPETRADVEIPAIRVDFRRTLTSETYPLLPDVRHRACGGPVCLGLARFCRVSRPRQVGRSFSLPPRGWRDSILESGAWRLHFLASIALVVVGLVVRFSLSESPDFEAVVAHGRTTKCPLCEVVGTFRGRVLIGAESMLVTTGG